MSERLPYSSALVSLTFWGLLLLALFLTSSYSYLLFQSIAGLFSVVIATGIFAIAWNARHFQENNYLLFLGIAYLFVGLLDLLYTLSTRDLGAFPGAGPQLPAYLWDAARTLEGLSLFLAPRFIGRRLRPYAVLSAYFLVFAAIIILIFVRPLVPSGLIAPGPLSLALEKTTKYVNSVVLVGAMALLWRQRREFEPGMLHLLLAAIALAVGSEVSLTFMAKVSAQAGLVGHLLKIASLYFLYRALIVIQLIKPYHLLSHNLSTSSVAVRREKDFADRLIDLAQVIVLVLDGEGRIVRLNRVCETITGYALADVKDRPFWEVFPAPEEVAEVQEAFFDLVSGDFSQSWQLDWVSRNGTRRLIAWSNTAFPREDGSIEYVIGTGVDISEHREFEKCLKRLDGRLEQQISQKPDVMELPANPPQADRLSPHPWRNLSVPVRWLEGYCQALEAQSGPRLDERGRQYLERLHGVVRQLGDHFAALQEYAGLDRMVLRREEVDLSLQARLIAAGLKVTVPGRSVEFRIETGLTAVGDPRLFRQLIKNLLGNAWKFTEPVPHGKIEFGSLPLKNGSNVLFVRDNRTDFGSHHSRRLFWSLLRLQAVRDFSGTDLSLAIVKTIISRYGGRLWADGSLEQGVTFYFTLPNPPPGNDYKAVTGDRPGSHPD